MKKQLLTILLFIFVSYSCKKDGELNNGQMDNTFKPSREIEEEEEAMKLGNLINDPYKMDNILLAYQELKDSLPDILHISIQPTHFYLKFTPQNNEELQLLKSDSSLVYFDFPLHYEITNNGTYYHDPNILNDSLPTYQYCVLPVEKNIPDVSYELLYNVFIPKTNPKNTEEYNNLMDLLDYQANNRLGYNEENNGKSSNSINGSEWHPQGYIKIHDHLTPNHIPLVGVSVHARRGTHVESGLTNAQGRFYLEHFHYSANYSIKWERYQFEIKNGWWWQAWFNGPYQRCDWNLDINSGMSLLYGSIHRAAYRYYYDNNQGIERPPIATTFYKLSIAALNSSSSGGANGDASYYRSWTSPSIRIYRYNSGNERETNEIFSTTIHELAHAAHWTYISGYNWSFKVSDYVIESWGRVVQRCFTNDEYRKFNVPYSDPVYNYTAPYRWSDDLQLRVQQSNNPYTSCFIDLIDSINQREYYSIPNLPVDRVANYSLHQIESSLKGNTIWYWNDVRDKLKNDYSNPTEQFVDELFANF